MSYDRKCFELARAFMEDNPELLHEESTRIEQLAQAIQTVIEDTISDFTNEDDAEYQEMRREYMSERDKRESREDPDDPRGAKYAERMLEAADMERKRIREEGR